MVDEILHSPIEYLKGVGPKRGELLKSELGIFTLRDLLYHFPFRYIDRTKFHRIDELTEEMPFVQISGVLQNVRKIGYKKSERLSATIADSSGELELVWFKGIKWITGTLKEGQRYVVFGRPTLFKNQFNIAHPEIEHEESFKKMRGSRLQAVYSSTEKLNGRGLNSKGIWKLQQNLAGHINGNIAENLPDELIRRNHLMTRKDAFTEIHFPSDNQNLVKARNRIKIEELFFVQLRLLRLKLINHSKINSVQFEKIADQFNSFYHERLKFELTDAQKRVIKEIRKDVNSGHQMNRLLQGDVGSGKTVVALMAMLMAVDNGYQAALMAPTEILAQQHFQTLAKFLQGSEVGIELLTGSTKAKERKSIHERLQNGTLHFLVGTHALIEDVVQFHRLGLVVVDEQHRFGVAQRAAMWKKSELPPHNLVMTATPIPRTLAMTLYGDLDISVIDELPPGRKPIKTIHRRDAARLRVLGFMEEEIKKGRQIYVVYPLIKESEKLDYKDLMDGYESMVRRFPAPNYQVSIVHGQMKSEDKDYEMNLFASGKTNILVATTVIEVGVDVPNASVMVIESAEKFGLSQLHQLRGRVGRGSDQSYCILMTGDKLTREARTRLETMVRTNDGFEIAEVDLKLRGPGDFHGTQQSGVPIDLQLTDLSKDNQLIQLSRNFANELLNEDPNLSRPENARTKKFFEYLNDNRPNWSRIA